MKLSSKQRKFLRSKAHHLKPVLIIGKMSVNEAVLKSVDEALKSHELIKLKFNSHKESKSDIVHGINRKIGGQCVGIIGNTAIIFRQNSDPEDQIYKLS